MKRILIWLLCGAFCLTILQVDAQERVVSRKQFFTDTAMVMVTIQTDLKKLQAQRKKPAFQPGKVTWYNADSTGDVTENIKVRLRGNYRRENCGLASLMVDFSDSTNKSRLGNLKNLKLVAPCEHRYDYEQLIIKEFLVYKMYNLLTEKSFRVRLLQLSFQDINKKVPGYNQYAFAIEPIDDLAKREQCVEEDERQVLTQETNRTHTTLVTMFQFMIANTDWSIPIYHNIKLIVPKDSPRAAPYVIPYDFDYCGLVNAPYAVPHESTGLTSVTERMYMGFPRTIDEIQATAALFKAQKENIYNLINNNSLLGSISKREMTGFLDDFYYVLNNEGQLKIEFINNARKK